MRQGDFRGDRPEGAGGDLRRVPGHWEFDLPHQVIRKELFWVEVTEAAVRTAPEEHDDWRWAPVSAVEGQLLLGIQPAHVGRRAGATLRW